MNSSLPKWTKWLVMFVIVAVLAVGAVLFVQHKVQTETRAALEKFALQKDIALAIKDVRYNLLQNVLTIEGIEAKVSVNMGNQKEQTPMIYTVGQLLLINPNRPLALAFARMQLDDVRGLHPVADALEMRSYAAGPEPAMTVAVQRVADISVDMDAVHEYLKITAPTDNETIIALARALAYKHRSVSGLDVKSKQDDVSVHLTLATQVEKDYANFALDSSVSNDMLVKLNDGTSDTTFTLKTMTLERLRLSSEFIVNATHFDPNDAKARKNLIKSLFQADQPFVASITFDDMLFVTRELNVPIKSLRYENSSTKPFTMRLDLKGLTLPTELIFDGVIHPLTSDLPTLTYNASLGGIFPYTDPAALTKLSINGSIDKLGSVDIDTDGLVDYDLPTPEAVADSYRLANLSLTFTEEGLTARAARLSQGVLGIDISKAGPLGLEFLWNALEPQQRTPFNRTLLEQFMNFLQKPGSISLTFTPPTPMTSDEIEQLQPTPEMLKLTVTTGPKTLNELIQALPKQ